MSYDIMAPELGPAAGGHQGAGPQARWARWQGLRRGRGWDRAGGGGRAAGLARARGRTRGEPWSVGRRPRGVRPWISRSIGARPPHGNYDKSGPDPPQ
jgi:hypothetical protein